MSWLGGGRDLLAAVGEDEDSMSFRFFPSWEAPPLSCESDTSLCEGWISDPGATPFVPFFFPMTVVFDSERC